MGKKTGVVTKIKDVVPSSISIHCVAHKLELAILDACKTVKQISDFEATLKGIFHFYHYSPKRRRELKEIANIFETDLAHFSSVKQVRWLASKERAVKSLAVNIVTVVKHLEHNYTAGNRADDANRAMGYLKAIRSSSFLKMLYFLLDFLPIIANLSRVFQQDTLLVIELPDEIEQTIMKLNALKTVPGTNMKHFIDCYEPETRKFGDIEIKGILLPAEYNTPVFEKLINNTTKYINNRFIELNEPPFKQLLFLNFHQWPMDKQELTTNGNEDINELMNSTVVKSYFSESERETIINDWLNLKFYCKTHRSQTLLDVYSIILQSANDVISAPVKKLLEYMLTVSPSTSACERGFSKVNVIKTELRTRLNHNNFQNQLFVMSEGPDLADYNPDPAIVEWLLSSSTSRHISGHKLPQPKTDEHVPLPEI
ncbi:zinc finger protein 862-like, partial [Saccoglossus kowalevskii]